MFLSLFYLASQSTSFFLNKSILHPIIRSIHPVLPYLGIWELAYIAFSRVYFSPVACLLRDVFSIMDTLATTFAYRLEEIYWSLAFWPILLRDAITGFPSFASDVAAVALRFFFGITSCRSPDFRKPRRPERNITRQTITISPQSEMNGGKDTVPPISLGGNTRVQSTPRISLSQASPTHPPDTTADGSTLPSVTTSATTKTLLPNSLNTRSQSERSTSTPTRGLTTSKRNKIPIYPSPPTICSPSATLRSPSAVFSATSIHKTVLITLPVNNVDSCRIELAAFPSSMDSTNTTLSSHTPSPQSPVMSSSSTSSTTTPVSSPHSSMLKFSTPPSPLRSKSNVKRIQSRKRTPATPCLSPISLLRRSPTPYPSHPNTSRASSPSLTKMTPSTPTTPKAKTRSAAETVVTTPTPKSKSQSQQQQQQVGKRSRGSGRKGNARGSVPGNAHASGGKMENRSERQRHLV